MNAKRITMNIVLLALGVVASCSGADGAAVSQPPRGGEQIVLDERVSDAARVFLSSADSPQAAFDVLTAELVRLFDANPDPNVATETALASLADALRTTGDIDALLGASTNVGDVLSLRFAGLTSGLAQSLPSLCPAEIEPGTVLYYVNGILTPADRACATLINLRAKLIQEFGVEATSIEYRLFYNPTGSEDPSLFCRAVGVYAALRSLTLPGNVWSHLLGIARRYETVARVCGGLEDVVEAVAQIQERLGRGTFSPAKVERLRSAVIQDVRSGKRVILVGHSQGNLFIQQALSDLGGDVLGSVGVVAIGSPATDVNAPAYGGYSSHMLQNDILACAADVLGPILGPGLLPAPEPNLSNPLGDSLLSVGDCGVAFEDGPNREARLVGSWSVHSIDESYLWFEESLAPIRSAVMNLHRSLLNDGTVAGQGVFQVTATWDANGDIDLHVFEPTGAHVFWANRTGDVGQLDRDDTVLVGPENYFVCSPDRLVPGEYEIYVNNFAGANGTNVAVHIRAGTAIASYVVTVGPANVGQDLLFVASVVLEDDGTFRILP
jgi:hypothetical protein